MKERWGLSLSPQGLTSQHPPLPLLQGCSQYSKAGARREMDHWGHVQPGLPRSH